MQCHVDLSSKVYVFHQKILLKLCQCSCVIDNGSFASILKAILEVLSITIIKKKKRELLICHMYPKRSLNRAACEFLGLWSRSANKILHHNTNPTVALPAVLAEWSRWQRLILPLMQRDRDCISELTHTGMMQSHSLDCSNYDYFVAKWNLVPRAINTIFIGICHLNPSPEKSARSL